MLASAQRFRLTLNHTSLAKRLFSTRAEIDDDVDGTLALILGKPGGGKGTISKKILSDFPEFQHLSTGDILRRHVHEETEIGKEAKSFMDSGNLVPDELIVRLVTQDASAAIKDGNSLLLDGFPRNIKQAEALNEVIDVDLIINLDIPTETIVERISDRWIHSKSGRIYSYSYNPPQVHGKDDITGEDLVQRDDDKPEFVRRRLQLYSEANEPLVNFYKTHSILKTFKGTKSDVIYVDVKEWLENNLLVNPVAVAK